MTGIHETLYISRSFFSKVFTLGFHKALWMNHTPLQWRHNERDGVSNHRRLDCSINRLSRRRSNKTSKLPAPGLCGGNSPITGEFPAQRASNAENVSIWWHHHVSFQLLFMQFLEWRNRQIKPLRYVFSTKPPVFSWSLRVFDSVMNIKLWELLSQNISLWNKT